MRGWIAWASNVRARCKMGLVGQGAFYTMWTREDLGVCEVVQWVKQGHQHSEKHPAQEEHSWEQRLAQLRLRWESCKKPKAPLSDTPEGSKEKQQSQWLGLARQAKCGKPKATSTGNRADRLTGQDCAKAGQRQLQL